MTERQTPAIVLTVREYGEADLMVNFLTPGYGPLTGIAKHARKSRRRFAHCLEPLSRVVFFLSPRPGRDLEFLQKGELVKSFPALRRDLKRLGAAAVLAEVAGLLAGPPEAYRGDFRRPGGGPDPPGAGLAARFPAARLPAPPPGPGGLPAPPPPLRGLRPEPAPPLFFSLPRGGMFCGACRGQAPGPLLPLSPGAWKLLRLAQDLPRDKLSRLRFPPQQRDQSLTIFKAFLRYHLGKDLKSWSFWDKVNRAAGVMDQGVGRGNLSPADLLAGRGWKGG